MEEYVKEAPQTGSTWERQDIKEKDESSHKEETPEAAEGQPAKQETEAENEQQEPELLIECESPPMICTDDFLGFNDFEPKAAETEESSLPTIAISSNGTDPPLPNTGLGGTGWGMALFSATTSNTTPAPESSVVCF